MNVYFVKLKNSQSGFGILEIAIILSLLSSFAFVLIIMPDENVQLKREQERKNLRIADAQLISFIGLNGRLPCPDSTGDGFEDCGVSKGTLPYVTLGLKETGYRSGDIALKYGVFRKSQSITATDKATADSEDADLAVGKNRYEPLDANGNMQTVNNINTLDFCIGLKNGASSTFSNNYTYIQENNANRYAVAYAIASPGANGVFDGLNGQVGQGFNAASEQINPAIYDDHVLSRGFDELYRMMQCDVTIASLNIMATAVLVQGEVQSLAESLAEDTVTGVILATVSAAIKTHSAAHAISTAMNASKSLTTSAGLLSGAILSCFTTGVGCVSIPIYTKSVTLGTLGVLLSTGAATSSILAALSHYTATGMYADVAIRTNSSAPIVDNIDFSNSIAYSEELLTKSKVELIEALISQKNIKNQLDSAFATYNTNLTNITEYATANDDPNFSGIPEVISKTQSMYAAIKRSFELRNIYSLAEQKYIDLKTQCDACPNPNVDTIIQACTDCSFPGPEGDIPSTVTIPEYTISACEISVSGTIKICDEAAAQKLVSDEAETAVNASRDSLVDIRNKAMAAALNFQVYSGNSSASCESTSSCLLPRWLDNTWEEGLFSESIFSYLNIDNFVIDDHYFTVYLLKQEEYEIALQITEAKQSIVDSTYKNILHMQCLQDGKTLKETPTDGVFECVESIAIDQPTPVNFARDAIKILDSADQQGL